MKKIFFALILGFVFILMTSGQQFVANYDEQKVPVYTLPDPLIFRDGRKVRDKNDWSLRRKELLSIFEKEEYGISPVWEGQVIPEVLATNENALSGKATMKEIRLTLKNGQKELSMTMLLCLPKGVKKAPVFLGLNFNGNHTVTDDPLIALPEIWQRKDVPSEKGKNSDRGKSASNWQVNELIARVYGLATIYYCDIDPDFDDGFKNGVHSLYEMAPDATSWGSVAAWAWGLSRALDYLEKVSSVDAKKVIAMGHSRLGKAAVWAGVADQRFAAVISNNSGCGGAALSKRIFGETVGRINTSFPHWFCENFNKYNEKEDQLPVDQHELLALMAPRPVYVASAEDDKWADPKGEFLSCVAASPVYVLLGKKGFPATEMPAVNSPVLSTISYHIRTGGHDVTLYDWQRYCDFADMIFKQ